MHRDIRCLAAFVFAVFLLTASGRLTAAQDPAKIVPKSDLENVLGGKFKVESPEPGVLFYTEDGMGYRSVQVYLTEAKGRLSDLKAQSGGTEGAAAAPRSGRNFCPVLD